MFDIERVRATWAREAAAIDAVVLHISDVTAREPVRSDGWTAQDLLGHIANASRAFIVYLQRDPARATETVDIDAINAEQRAKNQARAWADVQAYWVRVRDDVTAFLAAQTSAIGDRPAHLPWRPDLQTAGLALRALMIHTRSHREELEQAFPPVQA